MRPVSRIAVRLLLFNSLLVFLPAAGLWYFDVYEKKLLAAQERAMVQQGRLLAAALGGQGELTAEPVAAVLKRLGGRTEARLRIYGRGGTLLGDSSRLGPKKPAAPAAKAAKIASPAGASRESPVYKAGAAVYRLLERLLGKGGAAGEPALRRGPPPPPGPLPEVERALAGRYGAGVRRNGGGSQPSLLLLSAVPVESGGRVVGAVLVSQSTVRILRALQEVRLRVFQVFLGSVALAAVLSLLVATTIARPLQRLAAEAHELLDRRGRLRGKFRGSNQADEIGELARALEKLTARLRANQDALEAFAADVSHELKNPLAAIRSAAELLAVVEDPEDRERFAALVEREIARSERLLAAVREIGALDAAADAVSAEVDLARVTADVVAGWRARRGDAARIELASAPGPLPVRCEPERLVQVIENLLDNAMSFAPAGSEIQVCLERDGDAAALRVEDRGPGFPAEHLDRVFDRFFSYRPGAARGADGHIGLGLAIVKAIVLGRGGSVAAANRPGGGARVEIRLPVA